jgi:hypothetical protein
MRLPSCPAKWLELEWHCLWKIYGIFAEYILFVEAPGAWTLSPFSHAFVQEVPNCQSGVLRHARRSCVMRNPKTWFAHSDKAPEISP